jgi:hypothetical protein
MFAFAGLSAGDDMTDDCDPDRAPGAAADKAVVIACVNQLVAEGKASWRALPNGDIELCLASGELFLLSEENITRLS